MFSVVIPTRDRSSEIRRLLDSLDAQTMPPSEVIVVDDGSKDDTPAYLSQRDDGTIVVRTTGTGVAAARNAGADRATARYLVFLDDDDQPYPGWLEGLGRLVAPDVGILSCSAVVRWEDGSTETRRPEVNGAAARPLLLAGAFAVRRDSFLAVGGYLAGLTYAENTELGLRLLPFCEREHLAIRVTEEPLIEVRRAMVRDSARGRSAALLTILDEHRELFIAHPDRRSRLLAIAGVDAWREGDRADSRRLLRAALRARPLSPRAWARVMCASVPPLGARAWRTTSTGVGSPGTHP